MTSKEQGHQAMPTEQTDDDRAEVAAALQDLSRPWTLDSETYADLYGQVCDVAERMWEHWPLDDGTGLLHTSSDARAAANRIFEIFGIEQDSTEAELRLSPELIAQIQDSQAHPDRPRRKRPERP